MKTELPPTPPPSQSNVASKSTASSELVDLKRTVGEIITARVLSASLKAEHQTSQATGNLLQSTPASSQPGLPPEARAAQVFSTNQQLTTSQPGLQTSSDQSLRLWQLTLQVLGAGQLTGNEKTTGGGKTLLTEILAKQLPADLTVGKLLTLKVLPQQGLRVIGNTAPEATLESALRPIMQALSKSLPLQSDLRSSLDQLLSAGRETTKSQPAIPEPARQLARQLSNAILKQSDITQPQTLKSALRDSGINLEANLLKSAARSADTNINPRTSTTPPETTLSQLAPRDLKALLIVTLSSLINHIQQSPTQALPQSWEATVNWLTQQVANYTQGGHPLAFPSSHTTTSQRQASTPLDAGEMLRALAQALSRIQVNQLNALQQTLTPGPDGTNTQVWFLELPIQGQRLDSVQLRLEKDEQTDKEKKKPQAKWKLILAFDLETVGPFQSHVLYTDGTVSATFWAEKQHTLKLVNTELPRLRKGLQDWGLQVGDLAVRKGAPPPPSTPISKQLIDERA
ncbi:flagellar hook-length control protein FliK [Hahella ganghwensis]|uniref:flagellar hook-length control protein FliK n=1 Tax=Hahella ganghwensis TaxID=286420 RepID=UPI000375E01A|nr:flagellar hook-length control protein FliK [Hahella ganghwensis]